jgi:hypothetical protein
MDIKKPPQAGEVSSIEWQRFFESTYNGIKCPAFQCYLEDPLDTVTATPTLLPFSGTNINWLNCWDIVNYRFIPKHPGFYHVGVQIRYNYTIASATDFHIARIRKNGSDIAVGVCAGQPVGATILETIPVAILVYMNGTTDYVDFQAQQTSGSDQAIHTGATSTYAWGFKITS